MEVTEVYLARIERLNPQLGAVLDIDRAGALRDAASSAGRWAGMVPLSPIDGAPVLIKVNIAVAGLPWHGGIGAYRDQIAQADATCVQQLRAAGAIILGTVNMHEAALGATTDNPWFGRCQNPWRHGLTPGGSSGGSGAAVAAGLCAAALGTDTMGSVRLPSAYCGVFGHKPAMGAISENGVMPLSWTLDHVGVHARSTDDCAALLNVLAPGRQTEAKLDPSKPLASLIFDGQVEVDVQVLAGFEATIARATALGMAVQPVRLKGFDYGRMRRLGLLISEAEGFVVHQARMTEAPDGFSEGLRKLLTWGAERPAHQLARAYRDIEMAAAEVRDRLKPFAGLLMPSGPQPAFDFEHVPANQADFTAVGNFTGMPATAFPVGLTTDGRPLSCQIMAENETTALTLAGQLAQPVGAPSAYRG